MAQPRPPRISRRERLRRLRQENAGRHTAHNMGLLESLRQRFNPNRQSSTMPLTSLPTRDRRSQRRDAPSSVGMPLETVASPRQRKRKTQTDLSVAVDKPSGSATAGISPLWDVIAIVAWAILLFRYWRTGKLYLLIHPNYMWLTVAAGVVLMGTAISKLLILMTPHGEDSDRSSASHVTLFPPILSIGLLITIAVAGLVIEPRAFASQTAIQRGLTDATPLTRVRPQAFRATVDPQSKSIIDWVRTLNAYPEPDAYTGQRARVQGFVVHPPGFPKSHLLISRFVITCCAADVYPVGLPVRLPADRAAYPPDQWLEVQGVMTTEVLDGTRQLVISATSLKSIATPKNPYDY